MQEYIVTNGTPIVLPADGHGQNDRMPPRPQDLSECNVATRNDKPGWDEKQEEATDSRR